MNRAAAPFSVLFAFPDQGPASDGGSLWPDDLVGLNLNQVFDAITASRREYALAPFLRDPLPDVASVEYRQAVFRDLETGFAPLVENFAGRMRQVRSRLTTARQRRHGYEKASWFLAASQIYCQAVAHLYEEMERGDPASEGLRRCHAYLGGYVRSERFVRQRSEGTRLEEALRGLRYCVRLHGGQVAISDYRGEPDYSSQVLATFKKFQVGDVPARLLEFRHDFQNHVQEMIVDRIAAVLHHDLFSSLLAFHEAYAELVDPVISRFDREIQLYLGYLELIATIRAAGLPFCYPEMALDRKQVHASGTFDLALARKLVSEGRPVVVNDIELGEEERIALVSGPNQGGKTTFARTFGQLHHIAALGLPVPGASARLSLCDRVLTHFAQQEQLEDLHSGLEAELLRVRGMLERASASSIIVMNESFASTTSDDQLLLGREIIGRLMQMDVLAVYVTFIDELSRMGPSVVSMVSTVRPENPAERTFKVVRRPADGRAYAMVLAEAHGLTYEAVTQRVRS